MGRPTDIHHAIHQRQRRPLLVTRRINGPYSPGAARAVPGTGRGGADWAVAPVQSGRAVQRVQPLNKVGAVLLRARYQVDRSLRRIDDRGAYNVEVCTEILVSAA